MSPSHKSSVWCSSVLEFCCRFLCRAACIEQLIIFPDFEKLAYAAPGPLSSDERNYFALPLIAILFCSLYVACVKLCSIFFVFCVFTDEAFFFVHPLLSGYCVELFPIWLCSNAACIEAYCWTFSADLLLNQTLIWNISSYYLIEDSSACFAAALFSPFTLLTLQVKMGVHLEENFANTTLALFVSGHH